MNDIDTRKKRLQESLTGVAILGAMCIPFVLLFTLYMTFEEAQNAYDSIALCIVETGKSKEVCSAIERLK